jgi:hypothetical protein
MNMKEIIRSMSIDPRLADRRVEAVAASAKRIRNGNIEYLKFINRSANETGDV